MLFIDDKKAFTYIPPPTSTKSLTRSAGDFLFPVRNQLAELRNGDKKSPPPRKRSRDFVEGPPKTGSLKVIRSTDSDIPASAKAEQGFC